VCLDKNIMVVNLTGGLGNQLFQLAAAMALSDGKNIYVEKSIGQPRKQANGEADVEAFELPSRITFGGAHEASRIVKRVLNLSLRVGISSSRNRTKRGSVLLNKVSSLFLSLYLRKWRDIVTPSGIGFAPISLPKRPFLVGYFQSFKWPDKVYLELTQIKLKHVRLEVQDFREKAAIEKPILVHVRLGDYISIDSFGIPSREYYQEAINYILDNTPLNKIWLFSNEPEKAAKFLPDSIQSYIRVIPESEFSPAETMELMRYCHAYVIGNSTFSWWGAYLSYNSKSLKVGPTPWFKGEPSPKDIIPKTWKTIRAFEEFT
jgi:hypothetical protein